MLCCCCCNKSHCLAASFIETVMQMVKSGLFLLGTIHRPDFALAVLLCVTGADTGRWGLVSK